MNKRGVLIVISGPSGAGKDTVLTRLNIIRPSLHYSVSATTRQPRADEKEGESYYFLTEDKFDAMVGRGEMLEHACYSGNSYGTPRRPVLEKLEEGTDVILKIEVQGAMQVKHNYSDTLLLFLLPPSMKELERRLRGRGTDSEESIRSRLSIARREIANAEEYDFLVVNELASKAAEDINMIIEAQKCRTDMNRNLIQEVLQNA